MLTDTAQYYRSTSAEFQFRNLTHKQFTKAYFLKNRWVYRQTAWRTKTLLSWTNESHRIDKSNINKLSTDFQAANKSNLTQKEGNK